MYHFNGTMVLSWYTSNILKKLNLKGKSRRILTDEIQLQRKIFVMYIDYTTILFILLIPYVEYV